MWISETFSKIDRLFQSKPEVDTVFKFLQTALSDIPNEIFSKIKEFKNEPLPLYEVPLRVYEEEKKESPVTEFKKINSKINTELKKFIEEGSVPFIKFNLI